MFVRSSLAESATRGIRVAGVAALSTAVLLALPRCATSDDDPARKVPGGFADTGVDQASGGSAGTGGSDAGGDAAVDASPDASGDAASDSSADGAGDASDGSSASDGAADGSASDAGPGGALVLASKNATTLTVARRVGGAWTIASSAQVVDSAPAVAADAFGALVVVRAAGAGELRYRALVPGATSWSALAPVGTAGWTLGTPALASDGDAHLAFIGSDNKFYVSRYSKSGAWDASFTPVLAGSVHSFGPSAPALAARGSNLMLAFEGSDGALYTQERSGSFQPAFKHGGSATKPGIPPAIVARGGGSQSFVVAWVASSGQVMWSQGTASAWSPAASVAGASTPSPIALCALPNGDVALALRGTDDRVHVAWLTGGTWSGLTTPHPTLVSTAPPALAPGAGGNQLELAFIAGGAAQVSSSIAGNWTSPEAVASNGEQAVAIAAE